MRRFYQTLKNEYDEIWIKLRKRNKFCELIKSRKENRKLYHKIILKYTKYIKNPVVVELGCGTAVDINLIKIANKNISAYASDISLQSIKIGEQISNELNTKITYFSGDTLELPIRNNKVDIIFSQGLVEHFENPVAVIKEQIRSLRINGFLIINVPQKFTGYTLMKKKEIRNGKWNLGWESQFSYADLKEIGDKLKLKVLDVAGYQYWKSWQEPTFVLRDLYDKFHRRNPYNNYRFFNILRNWYECLWKQLEKKWGFYFLQNIIIVFQKKKNEDITC